MMCWDRRYRCRVISSRRRRGFTRPASCSWPISTAIRIISPWWAGRRARARRCISPNCFALRTRQGCSPIPSLRRAVGRACAARYRGLMRDFSADHRWLSLNTATVRKQGDLAQIIEACARHNIRAIDPWRDQVAAIGLDRAVSAVRDAGLELSGYCRGGMFTSDAAHRHDVRDDNRRAVDEASALGAPCIVLVVGGLPQYSRPGSVPSKDIVEARAQVEDAIAEMLDYAHQADMPLAIEPLHPAYAADRACVNTIRHALDICDRLDPQRTGALGVALDVYHIWWDPELLPQIARTGKDRMLAFHVCDWLVPTKDILNDRGMMGDGVIDITSVRSAVEAQGFAGYSEIEIFSNDWWNKPMDEVLKTCIERHRTVV